MKSSFNALLFVCLGGLHFGAHAQVSNLEISCEGSDIGAEVSINGQFKGECPIEAKVRAGTLKLRLVKKTADGGEQVFEQEIRIGEDVRKKISVVLPPAGVNEETIRAEGARMANEAFEAALKEQARNTESQHREVERVALEAAATAKREQDRQAGMTVDQRRDEQALAADNKGAAAGDAAAMARLGARYETGKGVAQSDELALNWYGKSAAAGDPAGMAGLGAMHYYGTGTPYFMVEYIGTNQPRDQAEARNWWGKAAAAGNGRAMHGMGSLTYFGQGGIAADKPQGIVWYEKAVLAGDTRAMIALGSHYGYGDGLNYEKAIFYFRKASDAGSAAGMLMLGSMYANGQGMPKNEEEGVALYRKSALAGSSDAMYTLGTLYADGKGGLVKNAVEADAWFRKGSTVGRPNPYLMKALGDRYANGNGVPKDDNEAIAWYRKAAAEGDDFSIAMLKQRGIQPGLTNEQRRQEKELAKLQGEMQAQQQKAIAANDHAAMFAIANRYATGDRVTKSEEQAVLWYRKAADAGNGPAMAILGTRYEYGEGVPQSFDQAVTWYRQAAGAGDAAGTAGLGAMYANGTGVARDLAQARNYWTKAADAGNGRAMNGMGMLYENGLGGVSKDFAQAVGWYEKGIAAGEPRAVFSLNAFVTWAPLFRTHYLKNGAQPQITDPAVIAGMELQMKRDAAARERKPAPPPVNTPSSTTAAAPTQGGQTEPVKPATTGFLSGLFGGLVTGLVDRSTNLVNSAATSAGGGVLGGVVANVNTQVAAKTKESIAKETGMNEGIGGIIGGALGGAVVSGLTADTITAPINSSKSAAGTVTESCSGARLSGFANVLQSNISKYQKDGQCGPIVQTAEDLRLNAIRNCKAGDLKSADLIYKQYSDKMVRYVKSNCP